MVRAKGFVFEKGARISTVMWDARSRLGPFEGRDLRNKAINRVVFIRREFKTDYSRKISGERGLNVLVSGSAGSGGQPIVC